MVHSLWRRMIPSQMIWAWQRGGTGVYFWSISRVSKSGRWWCDTNPIASTPGRPYVSKGHTRGEKVSVHFGVRRRLHQMKRNQRSMTPIPRLRNSDFIISISHTSVPLFEDTPNQHDTNFLNNDPHKIVQKSCEVKVEYAFACQ